MVATILLTSALASGIQNSYPAASANPTLRNMSSGKSPADPTAYLFGNHLYDVRTWYIPSTGQNFTLSFPPNWNVTTLGLNFFNGTLQTMQYVNTTTVSTSLNQQVGSLFGGYITGLKVPANSTIYQAMFNITGLTYLDNNFVESVNVASNSSYPLVDGNVGIAQRFFLSVYAENLSFQINLSKIGGTQGNLTLELRRSTSDNNIGELVRNVSISSTAISLGSTWVGFSIPHVDLSAGYYYVVLHTGGWLSSGGGYVAGTSLSKTPSSPPSGWVTSNRGVDWQNQVTIAGSAYYFSGFELRVHEKSIPTKLSNINLKIAGLSVSDNRIWNQSVWDTVTPYSFLVTCDYPLPVLNYTYKVWYYVYGHNNPFRSGYHVTVNTNKTTTATPSSGNFTYMGVMLGQSDLLAHGVINTTSNTVRLNLKLYNGTGAEISGSVNVTAWAALNRKIDGLTYTGPHSLVLNLIYVHPIGTDNNVTLSEGSVSIGPINSQIDNVIVNNVTVKRDYWLYSPFFGSLGIFREAFTSLPQFTLLGGSKLNCTVTVFNNFTASITVTGYVPGMTPSATIRVQNATPMIDLDGLTSVNITVTNPNGLLVNNTKLTLEGPYKFNLTVTGEGIYGIKFISNDTTGNVATRWIGTATVNDIVLASPRVTLSPATNVTSNQVLMILMNASYTNHPEIPFSGNLTITVSVPSTGAVTILQATWNSTARLYQASYQAPVVYSITQLNIRVQACDLKHRLSTSLTSTYVVPSSGPPPPTISPSVMGIVILAIVAVLVLIPALAYLIERYRRK